MTKRPSLRETIGPSGKAATAAAQARELMHRTAPASGSDVPMTTTTIHLPVDLLRALRAAAERRSARRMVEDPKGRGGRPSVSEVVVEMLTRHRAEVDDFE